MGSVLSLYLVNLMLDECFLFMKFVFKAMLGSADICNLSSEYLVG